MQDVRVIGVESGALLLATDSGSEFRLAVTSTLPGQVRQASPDGEPQKRISPKDVQAKIRGGLTADQVAEAMEIDVEYVRRFEGPVLAERSFILDAARRVTVTPSDTGAPDVFGEAIGVRLESGGAVDVSWSSWKHPEDGWHIGVRYTAEEVEHDARWRFDPKTSTLTPDNGDAHRLSHADNDEGLSPRLRAVEAAESDTDSSRFDSGAFRMDAPESGTVENAVNPEVAERQQPLRAPLPRIGVAPTVEERAPGNETADLLEALRRRRGERESAAFTEQQDGGEHRPDDDPQRRAMSVVDVPVDTLQSGGRDARSSGRPTSAPEPAEGESRAERKKRARRSMPSWDEIVFGTRSDDDLS